MAGIDRAGTHETGRTGDTQGGTTCIATWYGPHLCAVCGVYIIKAAVEEGGAEYEPPERLMRVFQRGAESGDPYVAYPAVWTPHVHRDSFPYPRPSSSSGG